MLKIKKHGKKEWRRRVYYVSSYELYGLPNGHYHPFGDEMIDPINIIAKGNDNIIVVSKDQSITLVEDDLFRIDENLEIRHICGTRKYENPFQKAMARTILGIKNMIIEEEEPQSFDIGYPHSAEVYQSGVGEKIVMEGWGDDTVSPENDVVVIHGDEKRFERIYIRPSAGEEALAWLENLFVKYNVIRQPSGMFDYYHPKSVQDQKDEEDRIWMEKILGIYQP